MRRMPESYKLRKTGHRETFQRRGNIEIRKAGIFNYTEHDSRTDVNYQII
jgi:hypothetical protein